MGMTVILQNVWDSWAPIGMGRGAVSPRRLENREAASWTAFWAFFRCANASKLSASERLCPRHQGLGPWTPLVVLPPDPDCVP